MAFAGLSSSWGTLQGTRSLAANKLPSSILFFFFLASSSNDYLTGARPHRQRRPARLRRLRIHHRRLDLHHPNSSPELAPAASAALPISGGSRRQIRRHRLDLPHHRQNLVAAARPRPAQPPSPPPGRWRPRRRAALVTSAGPAGSPRPPSIAGDLRRTPATQNKKAVASHRRPRPTATLPPTALPVGFYASLRPK
ncbi:hypothetical protein PVAP13_1NG069401 [Panicum virgatum]|uniref:Uncharacterized protein n=1 Tax=Panicum virgatum TaxID=38727 RepID=A0A8T0WUQ6_PANVG|nr:hypothetical protein PVAP13_1NG069401 [Panicum virgatum]